MLLQAHFVACCTKPRFDLLLLFVLLSYYITLLMQTQHLLYYLSVSNEKPSGISLNKNLLLNKVVSVKCYQECVKLKSHVRNYVN